MVLNPLVSLFGRLVARDRIVRMRIFRNRLVEMDAADLQEDASSLFNPDCDLSEVDQLFSQIPLPQGLEDGLLEQPKRTRSVTQPSPPEDTRFGPLVTQSQITAVQNSGVPVNTKKKHKLGSECMDRMG